jgi:diguanylate cyclase (GGDEF)-like protein
MQPLTRKLENAIREGQQNFLQFQAAAESAHEAISILEAVRETSGQIVDFKFKYLNSITADYLGGEVDAFRGRSLRSMQSTFPEVAELLPKYAQVVETGRPLSLESPCFASRDGERQVNRYIMKSGDGIFIISRDVTEAHRAARTLAEMATVDPLTGLLNRRAFEARLAAACDEARAGSALVGVIFCDLDKFKEINDRFGHACGDAMLVKFAQKLRSMVRRADAVARLGGDEFVVLLEHFDSADEAQTIVHAIRNAVDGLVDINGHAFPLLASVGYATATGIAAVPASLLGSADAAMYVEKARRKIARQAESIGTTSALTAQD